MEKTKVPALQRIINILDFVAENHDVQGKDIINNLGIPKSSAYLLLNELTHAQLLKQDGDGNYHLWIKLIELGEQASKQFDIRELARKHLYKLMKQTGLLCHLGIMEGNYAYYILKIESDSTIAVRSREGKKLSLYKSGIGKCLLAWQNEEKKITLINSLTLEKSTETTIVDKNKLSTELITIKQRGWAFDNEEDFTEVRCIAAPILSAKNEITAAISIVGTTSQMNDAHLPELAHQVMHCAHDISKELGFIK